MSSQGPNSASTFASNALGDPNRVNAWTNPSNAATSNDTYASGTSTYDSGASPTNPKTEFLIATDFGFSIPSGATLDGLVLEAESAGWSADGMTFSGQVYLNGSLYTLYIAFSPDIQTNQSEQYRTAGASNDLLGFTGIWSDANNANFGFAVEGSASGDIDPNPCTFDVDHLRMTVYYTPVGDTLTPQICL